jgi:hypothetical protein
MRTTVKSFESGKTNVNFDALNVSCLCISSKGDSDEWSNCTWSGEGDLLWEVAVLNDGTAITWCTE